ncbi:unnamed protein product [Boreogadus saida]
MYMALSMQIAHHSVKLKDLQLTSWLCYTAFVSGSSEELFFEPIKKLKLKTMDASNKTVKLIASQGKVLQ